MEMTFNTKELPVAPDDIAPDGSEIRLLAAMKGGGVSHCTLQSGQTSLAVQHQTIEEIWFFLQGQGQVWRKLGEQEDEADVQPGVSLTIPTGAHFQFRNTGSEPL